MHASAKYARSRQGAGMRSKALAAAMKRKEEYLGARVPKELKDKVIKHAAGLGIPVSILIRKVLEGAFRDFGVDQSTTNSESQNVPGRHGGAAPGKYPTVLGWENIRLNRQTPCADCGKNIMPATMVTVGLPVRGEEHIVLCEICSESL